MFKWIFLILLIGGGYYGYTKFMAPPSPAAIAYSKFFDALSRGEYDKAKQMAKGSALSDVDALQSQMTRNLAPTVYGITANVTAGKMINEVAGMIKNTAFKATKETKSVDRIFLEGDGSVCREQPGCMGVRCTHCVQSTHSAELCPDTSSLVVCSYQVTELDNNK
jgi:hypothetical protein